MTGLRVLHCPHSVGGNAAGLVAAERELGLDSHSVAFEPSSFGYRADRVLREPGVGRARFEARRLGLLWDAARHADVVHFNFGSTVLPLPARGPGASRAYELYARASHGLDLALLRRLGKGIVVTFQGDDARQGDVLRRSYAYSLADEVGADYYTSEGDAGKRSIIRHFDRYAHALRYLNPDLVRVLPTRARFMPYAHVDPREWAPRPHEAAEVPLVVHAPSSRDAKGTRHVLAAVEALRRDGVPLRFELVEGQTQAEARAVYEQADLVVDQLVAGWYGGLAVEAMALGLPVVAFVREEDLDVVPDAMRSELPLVNATPATVEATMRQLLTDLGELREIGVRSRSFVERWHDPLRIAAELVPVYEAAAGAAAR
jgi:glycosyltransferase involved in cell wall biosynthesis